MALVQAAFLFFFPPLGQFELAGLGPQDFF
jgi:uncharacterized membrane protein YqaE (UPF0057 family)